MCARGRGAGDSRSSRAAATTRRRRRLRFASLHATEEAFDCRRDEYVCALCDRGFSKLHGLNQHLASGKHAQHSYECKTCGKSFPRASHLLQHQSSSTCGAATDGHARLGRLIMSDFSSAGTLLLTNGADRFEATLRFDGAASPNPGRGGGGYVIIDVDGRDVETGSVEIPGWRTTNNQAEYIGLIHGLKAAERQMIRTLKVQGDSELVIRQMQGKYMVTSSKLRPLHEEANELLVIFSGCVERNGYFRLRASLPLFERTRGSARQGRVERLFATSGTTDTSVNACPPPRRRTAAVSRVINAPQKGNDLLVVPCLLVNQVLLHREKWLAVFGSRSVPLPGQPMCRRGLPITSFAGRMSRPLSPRSWRRCINGTHMWFCTRLRSRSVTCRTSCRVPHVIARFLSTLNAAKEGGAAGEEGGPGGLADSQVLRNSNTQNSVFNFNTLGLVQQHKRCPNRSDRRFRRAVQTTQPG